MTTLMIFSRFRLRPCSVCSLSPLLFAPFRHPTTPPSSSPPLLPIPFCRPKLQPPFSPYWTSSSFLHHIRAVHNDSYSSPCLEQFELNQRSESLGGLEVLDPGIAYESFNGEEYFLPVRLVISLLDSFHDCTELSWWIIIALSTLSVRVLLFPMLVLQANKVSRIFEVLPKLPLPLSLPLSGKIFAEQFSLFWKRKKAAGCPSFCWFFMLFSVQVPCFFLWLISLRIMSVDLHPGFDSGGVFWFQNLTELPHGYLGFVFPSLVAGMHYINTHLSFRKTPVGKVTGLFGKAIKLGKLYLDLLTIPLFFMALNVPQATLVCWTTNAIFTSIQLLSLSNPVIRKKLGFVENASLMESLKPDDLFAVSVRLLAGGKTDDAILSLRSVLDNDPEHTTALILLGEALLCKGLLGDANVYFEHAISKLCRIGHPTTAQEVDSVIIASQLAGASYMQQGKHADGMLHLQRVANLKEPEDPKSKAYYFHGLWLFASCLDSEGRKDEAVKLLSMVASYDAASRNTLKRFKEEDDKDDSFIDDLICSRKADY